MTALKGVIFNYLPFKNAKRAAQNINRKIKMQKGLAGLSDVA